MTLAPRPPLDTPFVAPRDEVEARVAHIWESVLQVGPLGADDDFFDLGGESLQAFAMLARLRDAFGVALTVRDLFAAGTIGGIAAVLRRAAPPG
jgi:acyl carrier protein